MDWFFSVLVGQPFYYPLPILLLCFYFSHDNDFLELTLRFIIFFLSLLPRSYLFHLWWFLMCYLLNGLPFSFTKRTQADTFLYSQMIFLLFLCNINSPSFILLSTWVNDSMVITYKISIFLPSCFAYSSYVNICLLHLFHFRASSIDVLKFQVSIMILSLLLTDPGGQSGNTVRMCLLLQGKESVLRELSLFTLLSDVWDLS